jgi:hypothetical protein
MEGNDDIIINKKEKFILNAIDDGWSVKKRGDLYIFTKDRSKEKNVLSDAYLNKFIVKYLCK